MTENFIVSQDFLNNVTILGNIFINETLNNCNISRLTKMDFVNDSFEPDLISRELLQKNVSLLTNLTASIIKPVIFMYLEEAVKFDLQLPTMHSSILNYYNDSNQIEFNVYGMKYQDCGLPAECYCPTQTNLFIDSMDPPSVTIEPNSLRFFKYFDEELRIEVKVTTNTVSYSTRCVYFYAFFCIFFFFISG